MPMNIVQGETRIGVCSDPRPDGEGVRLGYILLDRSKTDGDMTGAGLTFDIQSSDGDTTHKNCLLTSYTKSFLYEQMQIIEDAGVVYQYTIGIDWGTPRPPQQV